MLYYYLDKMTRMSTDNLKCHDWVFFWFVDFLFYFVRFILVCHVLLPARLFLIILL